MISGATGAIAVAIVGLVVTHGVQYLFAAVVRMGLLQLLFGALRLGKFISMVPPPERLHLRHLSTDCAELLLKAGSMVEVDPMRDPLPSGR
jgi:hypothetical protein